MVTADLNGDNKADVWKYYVPNGQGSDVLTCKQIDYNHDGKIDSVYYYDDAGAQTTLEEFDMDFVGRFEDGRGGVEPQPQHYVHQHQAGQDQLAAFHRLAGSIPELRA